MGSSKVEQALQNYIDSTWDRDFYILKLSGQDGAPCKVGDRYWFEDLDDPTIARWFTISIINHTSREIRGTTDDGCHFTHTFEDFEALIVAGSYNEECTPEPAPTSDRAPEAPVEKIYQLKPFNSEYEKLQYEAMLCGRGFK
jgi:hypothetical protein